MLEWGLASQTTRHYRTIGPGHARRDALDHTHLDARVGLGWAILLELGHCTSEIRTYLLRTHWGKLVMIGCTCVLLSGMHAVVYTPNRTGWHMPAGNGAG